MVSVHHLGRESFKILQKPRHCSLIYIRQETISSSPVILKKSRRNSRQLFVECCNPASNLIPSNLIPVHTFSTHPSNLNQSEGIDTSLQSHTSYSISNSKNITKKLRNGPGLEHFIANSLPPRTLSARELEKISHPYIKLEDLCGNGRKVYFDVYGCQMNVSDTEVAWSILKDHGYVRANQLEKADVVLVMTCAIREGAEDKVWNKLEYLRGLKNKRLGMRNAPPMKIGVLGCMAERLQKKLLEQEKSVDVVAGPDSYRDLPRLLALVGDG